MAAAPRAAWPWRIPPACFRYEDEPAAAAGGIHAVFPQRRHLPLRVRLFLDYLKHTYERPGYWG